MPCGERRAYGAAGVAGGGLDPQPLERAFAKDSSIAHTIQRNSSRQTEVLGTGFAMQASDETKHHFFGHFLDRAREIHVALSQQSFRFSGRTAEQIIKLTVGHGKSRAIIEVIDLKPKRAVFFQIDQIVVDRLHIFRLSVRSQAHDFVFP